MEFKNVPEKVPTWWLLEARGCKVSVSDDVDTHMVTSNVIPIPPKMTAPPVHNINKSNIVLFMYCVILLFAIFSVWLH